MEAQMRREEIWRRLQEAAKPVSATKLAGEMGVSRQIIVGDVALLRAQGCDILATARGYTRSSETRSGRYVGKIVCQHTLEQTQDELQTIVSLGGEVLDVAVEHEVYGEITGQLNIAAAQDICAFMEKVRRNEARLLSELTSGIHIHTLLCADAAQFDRIKAELQRRGLLYLETP